MASKLTKRDFAKEETRIKRLKKAGKSPDYIKSWLRGWRQVGEKRK